MGYSTIYMGTATQVYSLSLAGGHPRVKLWFDGNGQDTYRIDSAYIEQGVKTVSVCSGFYVPSNGRWSDWIDISSLTLPATVDLYIALSVPANIPINSGTNSPVAGAVPEVTDPVITPSTILSDPAYESTVPVGYSHKGWCSFAASDDGTTLIACTTAQVILDGDGYVLGCTGTGKVFISRDSGAIWNDVTPPDWFGYHPKVCCDSTGEKIAITSHPMDFPTTAYATKSDFNKLVAKHDGCIMTSVDGGGIWTARWPGYGANPGVWNSTTSLTVAVGNQSSFAIAGLNLSFYESVAKAQYVVKIYGYDGSGILGVSAKATLVSYISSTLKLAINSTNGGGGPYTYGDWLIYFEARYRYTSIDMSEDGQTIVAGMQNYNGENGAFISKDGGTTWSKLSFLIGEEDYSNNTYYPYGSVSSDGQKIVFSGSTGMQPLLFYSTNGGTTVNFTTEEASAYKTQICGDGTTAFNLNAALYQSTDGLANWVAVNAPATPAYVLDYSVSEDGNTICEFYIDITALSWNICVSIDSGTTWTTLLSRPIDDIEAPSIFSMFTVAISPDGDTVVVGESKLDATYDNVFIFQAPYTSPTETVIDPVIEMDTTVITNTGTITVSNNSLVLENETITTGGTVYTFKAIQTGLDNEIIIGLTDDLTAANIADVLPATDGGLFTATVSGAVVSVTFLSPDVITWSTTSSGITLDPAGTMTQTTTYTAASAPATLPCLTSSGSIAIPTSLPLLSVAAEASILPYGVGTLPLLWMNSSMSHQSITCDVLSTDAVKISLLEVGNDFLESLVAGLFDHADDDSFALQVTQWVSDNITYTADVSDTWNNATKTLLDGYGDCEDGAILLASLLINGGVDPAKVRVYIGSYTVNEVSIGHAWVEYFRGSDGQWVTLDWTAGSTYWYGIYQLSTLSKTYPDMTQTYTTATEYITSTNVVALADTEAYVISLQITSMAGTFPLLTVAAADQNRGTMARSLWALTANGTTGNFGNLSKSMPALTSSGLVGSVRADLSSALPVFTISAVGTNANRVTLSSNLPLLKMAGEAYQLNYGTAAASLPVMTCSAAGYPVLSMAAALELPMVKMSGAGRTARDFDDFVIKHEYDTWACANADLPLLTISAGAS